MEMLSSIDGIELDNATTKQNVVNRFREWWSSVSLRRYILLIVFCISLFAWVSCSFSASDVSVDEIAKEGYKDGYEDGFSFGENCCGNYPCGNRRPFGLCRAPDCAHNTRRAFSSLVYFIFFSKEIRPSGGIYG